MKTTKRISIIMLTLALSLSIANAQDDSTKVKKNKDEIKTLINKNVSHGGYIGLDLQVGQINGSDAIEMGGRMGWVINHCFTIGLMGMGFANEVVLDNMIDGQVFDMVGGYGGLFFEPILMPRQPIHVSFPFLIGAGGVAYAPSNYWSDYSYDYTYQYDDAFMIVRPGIEIELNILKFVRLGLGASYKIAYDVDIPGKSSNVLNGMSAGMSLKIGKF